MARLPRVLYQLFGADGPNDDFGQFGSKTAGSPVKTKSISVIQSLAAWSTGFKAALVSGNRQPYCEDMNSAMYVHAYMTAYLMQEGVPEYDGSTTYHQYSIVKKPGTFELYGSKINDNISNALPSQTDDTNWQFLGPNAEAPGTVKDFAGASVPSGYLACDGSAISRTTYANLFTAIGTVWGVGDGVNTFNVPDLRGRATIGDGTGAGLTARTLGTKNIGEETHVLSYSEMPSHQHGVSDSGHAHGNNVTALTGGSAYCSTNGGTADTLQARGTTTATTGITIQASGGGGAHNNMQPCAVVKKIIKT
jgi:microcystin-dependent protein